jgi:hypothetical protein
MIKENATAKDVTDFYDNFWRDKKREKKIGLKLVSSSHSLFLYK